ncbi:hypothetical protein BH23GEM8_BH23GEM8_18600 [soil metagenome]
MVKRGRRKSVDPAQAPRYYRVARALRQSAMDLIEIADDESSNGNAIAIVTIHSAIAYADALAIAYGGFKSTEGEHERAVEALQAALGARIDPGQVKDLLTIVKKKDTASYQGVYYTVGEARDLLRKLQRFADWAEVMYEKRP